MKHDEHLDLPWYATRDDRQPHALDEHVKGCESCAEELAEIGEVRTTLKTLDDTPEPSPFLLGRTLARIDEYERAKAEAPAWQRAFGWWNSSPLAARVTIAVQAAAIVALVAGVAIAPRQTGEFQTLSAPGSGAGPRLTVAFQPGTREDAMRGLLREIDASIVDGPSALGLYTVRIPASANADDALTRLRARADLVRFAERRPN